MGQRNAVEKAYEMALQRKQNVVIDRANFDVTQRHVWISMAKRYGVKSIECVQFNIDPEICKERVATRENHPTIARGDRNSSDPIIDRFVSWLQPPLVVEGLQNVFTISSNEDFDNLVDLFSNGNVTNSAAATTCVAPAATTVPV